MHAQQSGPGGTGQRDLRLAMEFGSRGSKESRLELRFHGRFEIRRPLSIIRSGVSFLLAALAHPAGPGGPPAQE
jgi:hypothetical protein